ncbi:hypothetical protein [Mangrovimonas sp. YM274]|uniref:hypothetical protein n=1 Tax=Mangrovimonas sp. YM274 TaxID=3070660 RepID=UPI0027DBB648|nr:hypothetical protein [Mangrovimonas sp. YM274]WMI68585.1 hypothetical protein RBH95_15735 [Mangrovimonas sp. YM274]
MKQALLIICLLVSSLIYSQNSYTVNGETLELKTEIEGTLDLLWTIDNGTYRYFIKTTDNTIVELKNTKNPDTRKYQNEYKTTLEQATKGSGMSTKNVNLTIPSLKKFVDSYNSTSDASYQTQDIKAQPEMRLGVFGGITNSPFIYNPENYTSSVLGAELEVITNAEKQRHSGFLQFRHTFENKDFEYRTTEISLGYRFRALKFRRLDIYADVKFATLNLSDRAYTYTDDNDNVVSANEKETIFDAPFIFGIGADYRISNRSYIMFGFNNLAAIRLENGKHFSTDFTLGYKLKL